MASIKDVAKLAGVSVSTVSRVINNNPAISNETRDKILKVIKELNYSPNSMAQGLSNNRSYTITLLINVDDEKSFYNPFFYEVMHGIEKIVYKNEYCLIVANLKTMLKKEKVLDWLIKGKRTEGVILPSSIIDSKMVKELKKNKIPFVSIGEPKDLREPISWVDINNRQGGEQATNCLLDKGYQKIAFVGLDDNKMFCRRRFEGYKSALEKNKHDFNQELVIESGNSKEDGYHVMKKLLASGNKVDAVICADNTLSVGVIKAIREKELPIPNEIGVVSFDNSQIAELLEPSISTVNIDVFELGLQSANLLFRLMENPKASGQEILISTNIEERETTNFKKKKSHSEVQDE